MGVKVVGIAFKVLSVLVIPLIIWGFSLGRELAVAQTQIEQLQLDVVAAKAVEKGVNENGKALSFIQGQLEGINGNITEIKGLIRD